MKVPGFCDFRRPLSSSSRERVLEDQVEDDKSKGVKVEGGTEKRRFPCNVPGCNFKGHSRFHLQVSFSMYQFSFDA